MPVTDTQRSVYLSNNPPRPPKSAYVHLLLDLSAGDIRRDKNVLHDKLSVTALQIAKNQGSIKLETNRGDDPTEQAPARLFFGNYENPKGPCRVLIPGLAVNKLDPNSETHDPELIIKALTIDGNGGKLDWTTDRIPIPCLWYYIENFFIKTPDKIDLSPFKGVAGGRTDESVSRWSLPESFHKNQADNLQKWFKEVYLQKKGTCPTSRPITENYLEQLQAATLSGTETAEKGALFFGMKNYKALLKKTAQL